MYHICHHGPFTLGNSLLETVCPHSKFKASDLRWNLFWPNQIPLHYLPNLLEKGNRPRILLCQSQDQRVCCQLPETTEQYSDLEKCMVHMTRDHSPLSLHQEEQGVRNANRGKKESSTQRRASQRVPKLASQENSVCFQSFA